METVKVQRANVVLRINADQVERFLAQGYNVLDDSNKIVMEAVPHDTSELRRCYIEHKKTIAEQELEIENLKNKIKELEKAEEPKPKQTRAKSVKKTSAE